MHRRQLLAATVSLSLAACRPASAPRASNRIVVVGAGLSGLVTAYELRKRGADVLLLEASARPGGRIRTVRGFRDGHYLEAGAQHVVGDPALMALFAELGIQQRSPPRGKLAHVVLRDNVRTVYAAGQNAPDDYVLSPAEDAMGQNGRRAHYFPALANLDPRSLAWTPELRALDAVSGAQWLQNAGTSPGYLGALDGMFPLGDGLASMSALALVRELAAMRSDMQQPRVGGRIAGGAERLPQALATRLGSTVHYRTVLVKLERRARGVTLTVQDASGIHRIEAARVVLTMPFSVLRRIQVTPTWSALKGRAIRELDSTSVTRAWIETESQTWLARGESGTVDTDLALGRLRDELDGASGAGILGVYAHGAEARRLAPLSPRAALEGVVQRAHPGAAIVGAGAIAWDREPYARGAYAYFKPGQLTELATAGAAPEGVVHFAGCGTSWRPGFMHGALDSARRVLRELA